MREVRRAPRVAPARRLGAAGRLLFVYGTLRADVPGPARDLLSRHADYVDDGTCQGRLYDLGAHPAFTPSTSSEDRVVGEIYSLRASRRALARLDSYEGGDYRRRVGRVDSNRFGRLHAWIYFYFGALATYRRIESGDYLTHLRHNPGSAMRGAPGAHGSMP